MRHVTEADLVAASDLLAALRSIDGLAEKAPGTFYRGSKAFVHFHHDPAGLFADVRLDPAGDFERQRVTTKAEQARLVRLVRRALVAP